MGAFIVRVNGIICMVPDCTKSVALVCILFAIECNNILHRQHEVIYVVGGMMKEYQLLCIQHLQTAKFS